MRVPTVEVYEFGPYRIDAEEKLLRRGRELVSLQPEAAAALLTLVRNAGRMVDKGELLDAVWPDSFVEDGALTRTVSLLRERLGDTGDEPLFIETVPKRGYRFVAPVRVATAEAPEQPARRSYAPILIALAAVGAIACLLAIIGYATRARPVIVPLSAKAATQTLAVLPFRSVSADSPQVYLADGMTQALVTRLANARNIRVVSFASSASGVNDETAWSEIVQDRSITHVLTGSVLRTEDRVRIDAHLMDPRTRALEWAKSYERKAEDLLELESTVTDAITGEIQASLGHADRQSARRHTNVEALDNYLRGRYFWNRRTVESLNRAAESFQQAIAADPSYAPAYAGLADSYALLGSNGYDGMPPAKAMPLAKAAAERAIALDPELSDGHVSLAHVRLAYDWDLKGAGEEFARGLALDPNSATGRHWYSHYLMASGELAKAAEQMREALRLEPLSPSINIGIGWCLYYGREYDRAIEQFRSVVDMDPTFPLAHQTLGMAYQQKGQIDLAIEEYKRATAFSNSGPSALAALAAAYMTAGDRARAEREFARLTAMSRTQYVPALYFASYYYAAGDRRGALEWGWKAVGERSEYLIYLPIEPRAGRFAGNPRFVRLLAAIHR